MIEKLISIKGFLKIRKYEISRELSLLNVQHRICYLVILNSFFFFSNQMLKGMFLHTNSYDIINETGEKKQILKNMTVTTRLPW